MSKEKINEINDILSEIESNYTIEDDFFKQATDEEECIKLAKEDSEKILKEIMEDEKKDKNFFSFKKIFGFISFVFKYLLTSLVIFGVLLFSTNYSAYLSIINSYINKEGLEQKQESLINSVQAVDIKEKLKEKIIDENKQEKESYTNIYDSDKIESKSEDYSIKNFLYKSREENINLDIEITPYENRIVIPKIGKNIPLIEVNEKNLELEKKLDDIFMEELQNGVVRYPNSQKPGEQGNTFIFGHSSNFPWIKGDYNDVFALLDNVVYDDNVVVYYGQKKYTYKIREKKVISPGEVGLIKRDMGKSEITLMTCWPIGTTLNRLVIIGDLQEEE